MGQQHGVRVELRRLCMLFLTTALPGCGGKAHTDMRVSTPDLPTFTTADSSSFFGSGSRLKAHVQDGGGGARALLDFYDTQLDVNCRFVENASGEYRCLPILLASSYFDANCTQPAFLGTGSVETRAGMLVMSYGPSCGQMAVPYSLVEEQPVAQLYTWIDGKCYPETNTPNNAWTVQPEPLTNFSSASLSVVGDEGEAQALRATADDGAYLNLYTTTQGQPCVGLQFAQEQRCLRTPFSRMTDDTYADDKCSGPALAYSTLSESDVCSGRKATRALVTQTDACAQQQSLRALLDTVPSGFSTDGNGHCQPYDGSIFGEALYRVGESVSSSEAPVLSAVIVGTGALRLSATANRVGTPLIQPYTAWRLASGEPCTGILDPSGIRRCAPGIVLSSAAYTDANCTRPIAAPFNCDQAPGYLLEEDQASTGVLTLIAAYAAKPYTGPVHRKQGDGCQPFEVPATARYFQRGAAVDLDTFPVITETTDR
jgi:hypothetical protein